LDSEATNLIFEFIDAVTAVQALPYSSPDLDWCRNSSTFLLSLDFFYSYFGVLISSPSTSPLPIDQ